MGVLHDKTLWMLKALRRLSSIYIIFYIVSIALNYKASELQSQNVFYMMYLISVGVEIFCVIKFNRDTKTFNLVISILLLVGIIYIIYENPRLLENLKVSVPIVILGCFEVVPRIIQFVKVKS